MWLTSKRDMDLNLHQQTSLNAQLVHNVQQTHPALLTADATAITVAAASFMNYLPPIAAGLSIVWLLIQIYIGIDSWQTKKKYYKSLSDFKNLKPGDSWGM